MFESGQIIQITKTYIRLYSFPKDSRVYLGSRKSYFKHLKIRKINEGLGILVKKVNQGDYFVTALEKTGEFEKAIYILKDMLISEDIIKKISKIDLYEVLVGNQRFIVNENEFKIINKPS